jgi:mono/diheme cytochrome c family protein
MTREAAVADGGLPRFSKLQQTMKVRIALSAALVAFIASSSFAEDAARMAASEQPEAEMVEKGKALYAHHCSHCHGFNMVNAGTIAYDLRQFPHNDKPRFVHSVTEGKNGRMPQWGDLLKPQEIDEIWAYVQTGGTQ